MSKIAVMLANGFEEVEGLTTVDLCRRAGIEVITTSISDIKAVTGSNGINIVADEVIANLDFDSLDMIVLPGGMPGTINLSNCEALATELKKFAAEKKVAAICAAPSVLGGLGILNGKTATCYPGFEEKLLGANATTNKVEVDGNVITSRGVGTAIEFALAIITMLVDADKAAQISKSIMYR